MGYWGYEPKDGDPPMDGFVDIERAAALALEQLFAKNDVYKHRGGAQRHERLWTSLGVLQTHLDAGLPVSSKTLFQAIAHLDELEEACKLAAPWFRSWSDPSELLANVRRFRSALKLSADEQRLFEPLSAKRTAARPYASERKCLHTSTCKRYHHGGFFEIVGNERGEVFATHNRVRVLSGVRKGRMGVVKRVERASGASAAGRVKVRFREQGGTMTHQWYSPNSLKIVSARKTVTRDRKRGK